MQVFASPPELARENVRLMAVMDRVGAESRRTGVSAEAMVIGLRHVFESAIGHHVRNDLHVRHAYDRFLTGCIRTYYGYKAPPIA